MRTAEESSGVINFLDPDTATEGIPNQFEATIGQARWVEENFKGKAKPKKDGKSGVKMALQVLLVDRDDGGEDYLVPIVAGPIENFIPSEDGLGFTTEKKGFFKEEHIMLFSTAVLETGARQKSELVGVDPRVFEGLRFFWERKPTPWSARDTTKAENEKFTVLVPAKFISDTSKGKGKGSKLSAAAAAGKAAGKAAINVASPGPNGANGAGGAEDGFDAVQFTIERVKEALEATDNALTLEEIGTEVFTLMNLPKYRKDRTKQEIREVNNLSTSAEFYSEHAGRKTWVWDAETKSVEGV